MVRCFEGVADIDSGARYSFHMHVFVALSGFVKKREDCPYQSDSGYLCCASYIDYPHISIA